MDERVRPDGRDEQRRSVRRLPVIVVLVIGVLVLVALILVQRSDLTEERSRGEAAAVAERFIEAHNSRDPEIARSLVADTAEISMNPVRSVDEIEMGISWLEATGWMFTTDGCRATRGPSEDEMVHVLCLLVHENAWSRALGVDPDTRGALTLDVVSGEITTAHMSSPPMSWNSELVVAFEDWLAETHPEDLERMYQYHPGLPALTSESINLWEQRTAEFVEGLRGQG